MATVPRAKRERANAERERGLAPATNVNATARARLPAAERARESAVNREDEEDASAMRRELHIILDNIRTKLLPKKIARQHITSILGVYDEYTDSKSILKTQGILTDI